MDDEAPRGRRRPVLVALAVALAIAAVPAGVALAGSDGQSSGNTPSAQDEKGSDNRNGERRDGHDCPKDRQGNQQSDTQL